MNRNIERAKKIIKTISTLLQEFEGAKTVPNVVFMTSEDFEIVKELFPYLIEDNYLTYEKRKMQVIFTAQKATVGLAFSFHTDYVEHY